MESQQVVNLDAESHIAAASSSSSKPPPTRSIGFWLLGGNVVLLFALLLVQHVFGLWKVVTPDTPTDTLLLYAVSSLNFVAFIVFTFIFLRSLVKLRRERQLGSKIKTRLVVYFITVTLLPITGLAVFSYIFLNRSLEKWFGRLPEEVATDARRAQTEEATNAKQNLRETLSLVAVAARGSLGTFDEGKLPQLIERANVAGWQLLAADGAVVLSQSFADATLARELEGVLENTLLLLSRTISGGGGGGDTATVEASNRLFDVAVVELINDGRRLVMLRERRVSQPLDRIVVGSEKFEELRSEQRSVRLLGLSTLSLLTLLPLVAATWTAIHFAHGIAKPIRLLAEAADEVARGNLTYRVPPAADAELSMLADAFNRMTVELAENKQRIELSADELHDKNLALEERRNYIEVVLQALSTGVISLDGQDRITTINTAAQTLLRMPHSAGAGANLSSVVSADDYEVLSRVLRRARRMGRAAEQTELMSGSLHGNAPTPVALTATALNHKLDEAPGDSSGVVLVMEDLSDLLAAQRAAAWSEVARRMAHEIKNPLTPIQLSAERIRRNFLKSTADAQIEPNRDSSYSSNGSEELETESSLYNVDPNVISDTNLIDQTATASTRDSFARIVDDCTQTITREVAGLKAMVDEFSRFARLPHAQLKLTNLNEVVEQTVALYEDRLNGVRLDVRLQPALPQAMIDAEQMRRVFVNLIDNAVEALASVEGERRVTLATGYDPARGLLLAEVTDTGHGIARSDLPRLFQPYFSTKGRGTGLGLAIVHRIIAEHGGRIRAETARARGAALIIELPTAN